MSEEQTPETTTPIQEAASSPESHAPEAAATEAAPEAAQEVSAPAAPEAPAEPSPELSAEPSANASFEAEPAAEAASTEAAAEAPSEAPAQTEQASPARPDARAGGRSEGRGDGKQPRRDNRRDGGNKGGGGQQRPPRQPNQANASGQANQPNQQAKPARNQNNKQQRNDQVAYRPEQVLQRMQSRPGVYRAYVHEAEALIYQIRLVGLGPALAVLLAHTEHKSKRRIYWDISKWVFKEQRIKGKNVRSLMESIVYGDPRFLLKATHSVVNFLEDLVRLSHEEAYKPQARSSQP